MILSRLRIYKITRLKAHATAITGARSFSRHPVRPCNRQITIIGTNNRLCECARRIKRHMNTTNNGAKRARVARMKTTKKATETEEEARGTRKHVARRREKEREAEKKEKREREREKKSRERCPAARIRPVECGRPRLAINFAPH